MREQDRQDFEEFALARTPELLRAAWLLTGDRYAAEDLVQDTLARLYGKWSHVRRADNPVAYARLIDHTLAHYLLLCHDRYLLEQRWPTAEFWRRRHQPAPA